MATTSLSAKQIKIYGHRGARGLSPENTLAGYKTALAIGVDCLDMDVALTKDNVVIVTHDYHLNPDITKNQAGRWIHKSPLIKELTFAEIQKYDVGSLKPNTYYAHEFPEQTPIAQTSIPSLTQVIHYIKKHSPAKVRLQIEIKNTPLHPGWTATPEELAQAVVKVVQAEGISARTEIQAFDWRALLAVQKLDSKIKTAYLTDHQIADAMTATDGHLAGLWSAGFLLKDYDSSLPKMIAKLGGKIWGPETVEVTPSLVHKAHQYGLQVITWTANSVFDIQRMIDCNVDGIISDRPDLVRGLMAAKACR